MLRSLRLPVDPYVLIMTAVVVSAFLFPAEGRGALAAGWAAKIAIGMLFFFHGARLSPQTAMAGLRHWRLHTAVLLCTYALFPMLGLAGVLLVPQLLSEPLYLGVLFLCMLPSTVQSSIAFTAIARGNVAAALCSASASNLLGIVFTPLLVTVLLQTRGGGFSLDIVRDIVFQILIPVLAGQLVRPLIGNFVARHKKALGFLDRGSILLVIYVAFSAGVMSGVWQRVTTTEIASLVFVCLLLLGIALSVTIIVSRLVMKLPVEDEIVLVFCGSKKSLAAGLPMANVLFSGAEIGIMVVPIMIFHQIQLMICAEVARRYARRSSNPFEQLSSVILSVPDLKSSTNERRL